MHVNSYQLMISLFNDYVIKKWTEFPSEDYPLKILDVGSMDVRGNGSYKNMFQFTGFQKNWTYTGLDIAEGNNVDIVTEDPYKWPFKRNEFDVVISGQCLEHVEAPWIWAKEAERVCKVGGLLFVIAPFILKEHRFPVDCYRFLPDGFRYLFGKHCNFEILECNISNNMDCFVAGKKKKKGKEK